MLERCRITVVHIVSGLTPDHWNLKSQFFHSFCSLTKKFNKSFASIAWSPSFILITQFHITVCLVYLSNKVIHLHSLLYNCELSRYITKNVRTTFTFYMLRRHILSINYVTKSIINASIESLIFKILAQEAVISFWIKLFQFTLFYRHRKIIDIFYNRCYLKTHILLKFSIILYQKTELVIVN